MNSPPTAPPDLACIGFGEAAQAFAAGWGAERSRSLAVYDIKTDAADPALRAAKQADYARCGVPGCSTLAAALTGRGLVFSLVTADQALVAAGQAAACLAPGALFLDCNSCAPGTKQRAAALVEAAGGRYVDVAVMAPVQPQLHRTPLLLSGPHAQAALAALEALGMQASVAGDRVGAASSTKMIRSIMVKGLEALVTECVLAGVRAGVDAQVLDSLQASHPGLDWKRDAAYMLERVMTHGVRRAAEMREVALTVVQLGLQPRVTRGTIAWQQRVGELGLRAADDDYRALATALLQRLGTDTEEEETMGQIQDYHDIPGTYVFDAEQSRKGYHLNMFCMSLRSADNRAAFKADEAAYLDRFPMSEEQREAVLKRQWNEMLRLGGNVYYTSKLAATDGINFQELAARMTGVSSEEYRHMMVSGGRPIEGNRSKSEWKHG